jgi:hypothetical protein
MKRQRKTGYEIIKEAGGITAVRQFPLITSLLMVGDAWDETNALIKRRRSNKARP